MSHRLLKTAATVLVLAVSTTGVVAKTVCYNFGAKSVCYTMGIERQVPDARVCFYIDANYSNRFFCEAGTRTVNNVPEFWRDRVSSIQIGQNSAVRICSGPFMKGTCELQDSSMRELSPKLLDHVYSYRTVKIR